MHFQRYQTGCLFGPNYNKNSGKWECRTPEEYIKKGEYNDASEDKNGDIIITLTQERDPKLFEDGIRNSSGPEFQGRPQTVSVLSNE